MSVPEVAIAPERPDHTAPSLLELHRAGRLVEEYPSVPALLAPLGPDDLLRAGRLLSRVDPDEVQRAHPQVPSARVAITGHGTLGQLVAPLTAQLARHGLLTRPRVSDFDTYVFDLGDPDSALYRFDPDLVLCVLDSAVVTDELPAPWTAADAEQVLAQKIELIVGLARRHAQHGTGTLVLNTLPLLRRTAAQLIDHRSRAALGAAWRQANARLLQEASQLPRVVVLDLDPIAAQGVEVCDPRLNAYAGAHLSPALLAEYAREVGHLARQQAGRVKKTLVLDLDNTLWGGVLGDDGPEGIEVAEGYRGGAFRAFQRTVKQIGAQGVLVAAVSKNDPGAVREVLTAHPEMTLRESDFVRVTANWKAKDANLLDLAGALNLGVDSFVFVDDSPYECGLIRHALPAVAVVPLDSEPALHVERLLQDGWFDTVELTAQDRARPAQYRDEAARTDFRQGFSSLEDYLRELGVRVRLERAAEGDVGRISQMTLRTNQFNLTTQRLQPAEVSDLLRQPDALVLTVRTADRFGDNGLVGALFLRRGPQALRIENFLLSCRVFARGVEQACLAAVLRHARAEGLAAVEGVYRPTARNKEFAALYPQHGFAPVPADPALFRHDLREPVPVPQYVDLTDELEGSNA